MALRPIHQSLLRPNLLAGAPRVYTVLNWTGAGIIANWSHTLGMYPLLVLAVCAGVAIQWAMASATKKDPCALDAYFRYIKYQRFYPGRAHPDAPVVTPKTFKTGAF